MCVYGNLVWSRKFRYMVWKLPKSFRVRVELRRALKLLDMCFGKGLVAS